MSGQAINMLLIKAKENAMRYIIKRASVFLGLVLALSMQNVFAHCTLTAVGPVNFTLPATISVNRNATVGGEIYTSQNMFTEYIQRFSCDANGGSVVVAYLAQMQPVPGMDGVYQTSVPNIGVRVLVGGRTTVSPQWQSHFTYGAPSHRNAGRNSYRISFVATGPILAGRLTLPSVLVGLFVSDSPNALAGQTSIGELRVNGSTNIVANSCTVGVQNIAVQLGSLASGQLGSGQIGATFKPTSFNINLNCNAGIRVSYLIEGAHVFSQTDGVLNNAPGVGMATGVGLQILQGQGNPQPLPLSIRTLVTPTTSAGQSVNIPLVVQYYKTALTAAPGQVQSAATFTLFYE